MAFVFLVVHHPKPEHREELRAGMLEMVQRMAAAPGFLEAGPWLEEGDGRIVGITRWESREAFLAAVPLGAPPDEVHPWETRPRERFLLDQG